MKWYYLRRSVHASWHICLAGAGVFGGVVLAPVVPWWFTSVSWLLTGIMLGLAAIYKQQVFMLPVAIVGGLLVGLWRGQIEQVSLHTYDGLYEKTIQLSATVSEDMDVDKQGNAVLRLREIHFGDHSLPGTLWVTVSDEGEIWRSDRIVAEGKLQKGFGTFAGAMYRADIQKVERAEPGDVALVVRNWFSDAVRRAIPEPEASLGVGYLVGQRRNLPSDLDNALQAAGLTHIVVASGYNLTILVRLARRLFARVSKYLAALMSGSLIAAFVAVTGLSPSMSRAGLVAGLGLLAWYYGRKFHPVILLSIAVATTVLFNPSYAWGDVGWQLSFAAFGGVMLLAPLLQAYFFGPEKPGTVRQILGETMAAWLCTLPILILTFGYVSNVAIIANLLVLPLVPLAMLLTFIAGVGVIAIPAFAVIVGMPATLLLHYMTSVATYMADLPWAKTELAVGWWQALIMYGVLIMSGAYMWWRTRLNLRDTNLVE